MAHRKPFDLRQRQEAVRIYRALRAHRRKVKRLFPPKNAIMHNQLRDYRELLDTLLEELIKPDTQVDPDVLNEALKKLAAIAVGYMQQYGLEN
ncbi:MAG TPA: hypothetical protein PLD59_14475 [Tepidisphaeraceae bacterium]|nr:hypothetical protein [Tepidisphaeraceae bacterium]